jgi:predicted dehydrogenase
LNRRGALIGFGAIAETTHLGALAATGLDVIAVVETSPKRCAAALQALPGVRLYDSVDALLAREQLEFVDICTPPHLHFAPACTSYVRSPSCCCQSMASNFRGWRRNTTSS